MKAKLTATATSSLRRCPRQYYLRFELGLSRTPVLRQRPEQQRQG